MASVLHEFLGELRPDAHALQWVKEGQHHVTGVLHPREPIPWTRYSRDMAESYFQSMHIAFLVYAHVVVLSDLGLLIHNVEVHRTSVG